MRKRILHLLGGHPAMTVRHVAPRGMSEHVRLDASGGDGVDTDLLAAHVSRQSADERLDRVLAARIQRVVGRAARASSNRRHENHGAVLLAVLEGLLGDEELRAGVGVEDLVVALRRDLEEGGEVLGSRVGHDDVDAAEGLLALLEELDDLGDLADVGFDGDGVGAGGLDLLDDVLGGGLAGAVVDDHFGATLSELDGDAAADTATGAGHESDLAV